MEVLETLDVEQRLEDRALAIPDRKVQYQYRQRFRQRLRERGYEVHLTRSRDTLIALGDRARLANRLKGERPGAVFLSIHANAASAPTHTRPSARVTRARTAPATSAGTTADEGGSGTFVYQPPTTQSSGCAILYWDSNGQPHYDPECIQPPAGNSP